MSAAHVFTTLTPGDSCQAGRATWSISHQLDPTVYAVLSSRLPTLALERRYWHSVRVPSMCVDPHVIIGAFCEALGSRLPGNLQPRPTARA